MLLQCTEASILVFAGCLWFDLPTHTYKNSPDQAAYICHLPLRQARSGLQRKCFTLVCLLDVSCNTDETFFFVENADGRTGGDTLDPVPVQELGHWARRCGGEFSSDAAQNLKTEIEFTMGGLLAICNPKAGL